MKRLLLLSMLFVLTACPNDKDVEAYRCFDQQDQAFIGKSDAYDKLYPHSITLDQMLEHRSGGEIGTIRQALSVLRESLWPVDVIPVCWEPEGYLEQDQFKRDLVRIAAENTWEDALYINQNINIRFSGWEMCNDQNGHGIRIQVNDEGPHVKKLGKYLSGHKNGMVLNFTFENWSPDCHESAYGEQNNRNCIYSIAVHEFGHALGITHEQNRSDTDHLICPEEKRQGTVGNLNLGEWDADSVMNYCNRYWNNNGQLSLNDYQMIRQLYFNVESELRCVPENLFNTVTGQI